MNRRVLVHVCSTNQRLEAHGLAAEVIALVALLPLSERTLDLLLKLALHQQELEGINYGMLEIDLSPKRGAVYHRRHWTRPRGERAPLWQEDHADGP